MLFRTTLFGTTLEIIWIPGEENSADMGTRPTHEWTREEARRRHHLTSLRLTQNRAFHELDLLEATDAVDEIFRKEARCDPDGRELESDDDIPSSQS